MLGRIQGGVLGVKPPFLGKHFQFARGFKKNLKHPQKSQTVRAGRQNSCRKSLTG